MPDKMKFGRSSRRRDRWWLDRRSRYSLNRGSEHVYLLFHPLWGSGAPVPVAWWPLPWGVQGCREMLEFLNFRKGFCMKKPPEKTTQRTAYAAPLDGILEVHPVLAEFLLSTAYDGDPAGSRLTSTLLIFAQDDSFKACLRDRQEGRCAWVAAAFWNDLLPVLEDALATNSVVWRDDRASGAEQAKRQKPSKRD